MNPDQSPESELFASVDRAQRVLLDDNLVDTPVSRERLLAHLGMTGKTLGDWQNCSSADFVESITNHHLLLGGSVERGPLVMNDLRTKFASFAGREMSRRESLESSYLPPHNISPEPTLLGTFTRPEHSNRNLSLGFLEDRSALLAAGGTTSVVSYEDLLDGASAEEPKLKQVSSSPSIIVASPSGEFQALLGRAARVVSRDEKSLQGFKEIISLNPGSKVNHGVFSNNDSFVVLGMADRNVVYVNSVTEVIDFPHGPSGVLGKPLLKASVPGQIAGLALASDDSALAVHVVGGSSDKIVFIELHHVPELETLTAGYPENLAPYGTLDHLGQVSDAVFVPGTQRLIVAHSYSDSGNAYLGEFLVAPESIRALGKDPLRGTQFRYNERAVSLAFTPRGDSLMVGLQNGNLMCFDSEIKYIEFEFPATDLGLKEGEVIAKIKFNQSGSLLALLGSKGTVSLSKFK